MLLVDGSQSAIDTATNTLLKSESTTKVYLAGGTGVVTTGFEQSITSLLGAGTVTRLAGANRYATSSAINRERFTTATTFYVASGEAFPDALSAAPVAGMQSMPLYLSQPSCMPTALVQHIIDAGATKVVIIGGTGAVSEPAARFRNC